MTTTTVTTTTTTTRIAAGKIFIETDEGDRVLCICYYCMWMAAAAAAVYNEFDMNRHARTRDCDGERKTRGSERAPDRSYTSYDSAAAAAASIIIILYVYIIN